jgi:hypothetical protein
VEPGICRTGPQRRIAERTRERQGHAGTRHLLAGGRTAQAAAELGLARNTVRRLAHAASRTSSWSITAPPAGPASWQARGLPAGTMKCGTDAAVLHRELRIRSDPGSYSLIRYSLAPSRGTSLQAPAMPKTRAATQGS